MTILDTIAEYARERVKAAKEKVPIEEIKEQAFEVAKADEALFAASRASGKSAQREQFAFEKALAHKGMSFICECKKASPSKGLIAEDYPYESIARAYEAAGADCISVLTEPKWFKGSLEHLRKITDSVNIPCIRKDFTVDEYMIYEAKVCGASAVLLICSILPKEVVKSYIAICDTLGLSALVETHDENEVADAIWAGARIIGVNNRNLRDFTVDTGNSRRLRELVPEGTIFVSESGVKTAEDVKGLRDMGADAVLVGETLMRAEDKSAKLAELKSML
ncbi:MAG: indole-3-glycerol phosphate synthase TrpC [Lachnospiraceae bacterium]|nr:indole-3-glycerol phosphate synthase TrpC [Lachnospiraceae bacterium]